MDMRALMHMHTQPLNHSLNSPVKVCVGSVEILLVVVYGSDFITIYVNYVNFVHC